MNNTIDLNELKAGVLKNMAYSLRQMADSLQDVQDPHAKKIGRSLRLMAGMVTQRGWDALDDVIECYEAMKIVAEAWNADNMTRCLNEGIELIHSVRERVQNIEAMIQEHSV